MPADPYLGTGITYGTGSIGLFREGKARVNRYAYVIPVPLFVAAAIAFTWPLARHPMTLLGATQGAGDPFLNLWILGWDLRTISTHPSWLLSGRIFDANIFYPARGALAFSDHQILQALASWPLYAATHDAVLAYNAILIASLALSGWTMYVFVAEVTGRRAAAGVAGAIWAFCPYRVTQLIHLQLQALYFLPLALLFVHRVIAFRRKRDAFWLGIVLGLQTIASIYYGLIGAIGVAAWATALLVSTGAWRRRAIVARLALAAVLGAAISLSAVWPYLASGQREGAGRELFQASQHSAVLASYLQAPPENVLYGRTGWLRPSGQQRLSRKAGPEQDLFAGFVVIALAIGGVIVAARLDARPIARAAMAAAIVGVVLSLGPDGIRPLYAALHRWIFGFQAIRAPARFSVLVFAALAVLAGLGVSGLAGLDGRPERPALPAWLQWRSRFRPALPAWLQWRRPFRPAVFVGALVAIGLEFVSSPLPFVPAPPRSTPTGQWLAAAPGDGAVLYLPLTTGVENTRFMVASLEHGRPIVNGYSGGWPSFYPALVESMAAFPSPEALLALREVGVRFVVAPQPVQTANGPTPLVERARLADGVVYELQWTPDIDAALASAAEEPPPPPPGALPFPASETMRFDVRWLNGPVALTAGDVTVTASRRGDVVDLALAAKTAPWMQRFYDMTDRQETRAGADLLPIEHREELNEGARRVRRTVAFDRPARRVAVQTGDGTPVRLPLGSAARDPLTALFYVRTLPLEPGLHVRVPINDAGRPMLLDVKVVGRETIDVAGRATAALRVEPRLVARVDRRPPPAITVWLSQDDRHAPLRATVDSVFGAVSMELVEYRAR